jgi:hypothetical protein
MCLSSSLAGRTLTNIGTGSIAGALFNHFCLCVWRFNAMMNCSSAAGDDGEGLGSKLLRLREEACEVKGRATADVRRFIESIMSLSGCHNRHNTENWPVSIEQKVIRSG